MSTKVYDAFRTKKLSCSELSDFFADSQNVMKELMYKYFVINARQYVDEYICRLMYLDADFSSEDEIKKRNAEKCINKILRKLFFMEDNSVYSAARSSLENEVKSADKEKQNFDNHLEYIKTGTYRYQVVNMFLRQTEFDTELESISPIDYTDYALRADMSIHPYGGRIYFMTFGEANGMNRENKPECVQSYFEKYGIENYEYWDNTDRPEDISARQWSSREKMWDKIIGFDAPISRGAILYPGKESNIFTELTGRLVKDKQGIISRAREEMVETYAKQIVRSKKYDEITAEKQLVDPEFGKLASDFFEISKIVDDWTKNDAINVNEMVKKEARRIEPSFGSYGPNIMKTTLKDIIPNYLASH